MILFCIFLDDCLELMELALRRLNQAKEAIQKSRKKYKEDIQTWLSAAITFLQTCKDTAEDHVLSNVALSEIYKKMDYLSELCSNPLSLANRISTRNPKDDLPTRSRRLLEDENFPSWVSKSDRRLLESAEIKANAVVAKDGSGDFDTISEAIQSSKGGRYVIYVKSGNYNEKISTSKDGITLIGDGKYSTIIYASSSVGKGSSLRGSSTFCELLFFLFCSFSKKLATCLLEITLFQIEIQFSRLDFLNQEVNST